MLITEIVMHTETNLEKAIESKPHGSERRRQN